jgi:hypothetical protein
MMLTFQVPYSRHGASGLFQFSVETGTAAFAGSRRGFVLPETCRLLISRLGQEGFSFLTGCASGVDACFRQAFADSDYAESSLVACAFQERADRFQGVYPLFVVPQGLRPRQALARRTLWITSHCSLLILFPSDPITRGSALAFKSAVMSSKPVFVVTRTRPAPSDFYSVFPSSLFGLVHGFWCIPPVFAETGLCYEPA